MKLLYTRYLNNNLIGVKILDDEKACSSYLDFVKKSAKLNFKNFKDLKINSNKDLLEISFINNGNNHIKHKYELFTEIL